MSDIVERLRESVTKGHEPTDELAIEAAAEIEDLRSANKLLHGLITNRDAEIERLRAALQEIASQCHNLPRNATADRIDQIARRALEGK